MKYEDDKSNVKFLSVLAYIGPLFVMGLFSVEKENPEVKFHSRQGGILFAVAFFSYFLSGIIVYLLHPFPAVSEIVFVLFVVLISVSWFILIIMGISGAMKNQRVSLPLVSEIDKIIKKSK